jgi:hypothetical protein
LIKKAPIEETDFYKKELDTENLRNKIHKCQLNKFKVLIRFLLCKTLRWLRELLDINLGVFYDYHIFCKELCSFKIFFPVKTL